jgi:hypothetical protein
VNKKEAKKTLSTVGVGTAGATSAAQAEQKFFASFFQKRSPFFFLSFLPISRSMDIGRQDIIC